MGVMSDENLKLILVIFAQFCEYTKTTELYILNGKFYGNYWNL